MGEHSRPGRRDRHALEQDAPPWQWAVARYGPVCGECGVRFDTPSPDCPHRLTNVHPVGAGTDVTPPQADPAERVSPGPLATQARDNWVAKVTKQPDRDNVLEGTAFNPPNVCGYCGHFLDDDETCLHNGWIDQPERQRLQSTAFADAVAGYNRTVTDAFANYRTATEAAWRAYQAAMTRASDDYDAVVAAAGSRYEAAARQAETAPVTDQPAGPYYECCPHCEHDDDQPRDLHEKPCSEGCQPANPGTQPVSHSSVYIA